jgi:hypothetical protein
MGLPDHAYSFLSSAALRYGPALDSLVSGRPPAMRGITSSPKTVYRIDVECGAARKFDRVVGLKLVQLLEQSLPEICNRHFSAKFDFHAVPPKAST